jgi:hypothetical protein
MCRRQTGNTSTTVEEKSGENAHLCSKDEKSLNSRAHLKQKKVVDWRHSAFFLYYVGSSKFVTQNVKYKF